MIPFAILLMIIVAFAWLRQNTDTVSAPGKEHWVEEEEQPWFDNGSQYTAASTDNEE